MTKAPGNKRRLAYILNYVNEHDTSHFVHILKLIEEIQRLGWQVDTFSEKGGVGTKLVRGIEVTYLSKSNALIRIIRMFMAIVTFRLNGGRLVFIRISRVAALVSILCGVIGIRTIYWNSGANFDIDRRKPPIRRFLDDVVFSLIAAGCYRFVTGPEAMLTYYAETYNVPVGKLSLLYNDVDIERFVPGAEPQKDKDVIHVLQVARFSPIREMTRYAAPVLAAMQAVAAEGVKVEWTLVGSGPELAKVQEILASPGNVSVTFLGAIPNVEIMEHYARADLFIMPSYREGMPRVAMEAMAAGLPLVSTDAGGTADLFGPLQREFVVSRDDAARFAALTGLLMRDPALRIALGQENRRAIERFSTPQVAKMYDALFSSSLQGSDL